MQIPLLPEQLSISLALICFLVIWITALISPAQRALTAITMALLLLAVVALLVGLAMRWERLGQGPFMTLFEVLHSNLFSLALVYALLFWRVAKIRAAVHFGMGFFVLLATWALASNTQAVILPPTFDHPWLWVHVISGKFFLAFCMTATSLALLLLWRRVFRSFDDRVTASSHDPLVWRLLAVAFVCHSFMLIAGAVWAHDAWGSYWSWDPLETWSLLTWLSLAVVLHTRITFDLPLWLGWSLAVAVFVLAFLTFFGVPFISHAPHKGVM